MSEPPYSNGLGLSGAARLERIERIGERNTEMLGDLGNKVERSIDRQSDHEKRIRSLELRFYGILAGLIGAAVYVIWNGGPPT